MMSIVICITCIHDMRSCRYRKNPVSRAKSHSALGESEFKQGTIFMKNN